MGKVFQTLILLCFLLSITSVLGATYQQGTDIEIKHPVRIDGGLPVSTRCNITVYYPNNTILTPFLSMTDQTNYFNFTIPHENTTIKGIYNYDIYCTNGDLNSTETFDFLINLGGVEPSTSRTDTTTRNILILFGMALFAFVGFLFTKRFPVRASLFLIMIWFILSGLSITLVSLQDEVLNPTVETFFSSFLTISFYINWFIFGMLMLIWGVTFFVSIFDFQKKKKEEKYGEE